MYASSFALKFNGGQGNMLILLDVSSRVYPTYNSTMRDFLRWDMYNVDYTPNRV